MIKLTPSLSVPSASVAEHFVRSSGPGGQNVNKVSTSVELRFDVAASGLSEAVQAKARALAGHRLTTDGVIVIHAHEHRTQGQNREAARERLADLLTRAARKPRPRRRTKPSAAAKEKRLGSKHHRSEIKRVRARGERED
jgi:ribosome-associated protein